MRTIMRRAVTPLAVIMLAACGDREAGTTGGDVAEQALPSSRTLADTVEAGDAYGTLEQVVENAALNGVLEGVGPYTLFAPADAAFSASSAGADFTDETLRAQSAALLRAHIVPGAITRRDVAAAIDRGGNGSTRMRTMANTLLTFSRDGETIVVSSENGARARLSGAEVVASNGVLQPVDTLLVRPEASAS